MRSEVVQDELQVIEVLQFWEFCRKQLEKSTFLRFRCSQTDYQHFDDDVCVFDWKGLTSSNMLSISAERLLMML